MRAVSRNRSSEALLSNLPFIDVQPDDFAVIDTDGVLMANLEASIAICLYDAVFEPGALLHLKALPDKNRDIELTDVVLAADVLLLEQTLQALQATAPRAQYWQAKVLAHCPQEDAAMAAIAESVGVFACEWLGEHAVQVVDRQVLGGRRARCQFRPQMGQLRVATVTD
jgi:chemotaxis receptor (MCP) glutamine deamidase CheD